MLQLAQTLFISVQQLVNEVCCKLVEKLVSMHDKIVEGLKSFLKKWKYKQFLKEYLEFYKWNLSTIILYFLKNVLHTFSIKKCITFLEELTLACGGSIKVIKLDSVCRPEGSRPCMMELHH